MFVFSLHEEELPEDIANGPVEMEDGPVEGLSPLHVTSNPDADEGDKDPEQ